MMDHSDGDYILALQLQEELNEQNMLEQGDRKDLNTLSLVDPYWEMTDPNPDIRALFLQFNARFFWGRLAGIEVRWSPRMTLCAGLCCYEGKGGLCSVRLSVPLLKLRPRKDLVETLLHEMIHAYLFVTDNNKDHDGHGPEFHKHMYRINKETGTNITVYHNFHDEVESYRQHWWRCDGPCRNRKPYYGYVKRTMNRAPSKNDTWWAEHQRTCGGTYTKIKEPEDYGKKKGKEKQQGTELKESKKDVKSFVKSMDIRIFGGKGVTLSGQKSSNSANSQTVSGSSHKIQSSSATSCDDKNDSDGRDSPSLLASQFTSHSQTNRKDKVKSSSFNENKNFSNSPSSLTGTNKNSKPDLPQLPRTETDSNVSAGTSDDKKEKGTTVRKSPNITKSKFSLADFSDSDDDDLCSVPVEHEQNSRKEIDQQLESSVTDKLKHGESGSQKDKTSDSDDVRAMLRKVWGEKSFGKTKKTKVHKKTGNNFVKSNDIFNGKKRPGLIESSHVSPVYKRIRLDPTETTDISKTKAQHGVLKQASIDDKFNLYPCDNSVRSENINSDKLHDRAERKGTNSIGNNSKLQDNQNSVHKSPGKDESARKKSSAVSPIERLFNKMKEKHKDTGTPKPNDKFDTHSDTIPIVVNDMPVDPDFGESSKCPVCNKDVPTSTINDHLDLCLTLKVI